MSSTGLIASSESTWQRFIAVSDLRRERITAYYTPEYQGEWRPAEIVEEIFCDLIAIGAIRLTDNWDASHFHTEWHPHRLGFQLQLVATPAPGDVRSSMLMINAQQWGGPNTLLSDPNILRIVRNLISATQKITKNGPPGKRKSC